MNKRYKTKTTLTRRRVKGKKPRGAEHPNTLVKEREPPIATPDNPYASPTSRGRKPPGTKKEKCSKAEDFEAARRKRLEEEAVEKGDDAAGSNTQCDTTKCGANQTEVHPARPA